MYCEKCDINVLPGLHCDCDCAKASTSAVVPGYGAWVAVGDNLPKVYSTAISRGVIVCNDGNVQFGCFLPDGNRFLDGRYREITKQVTHWMYLPEAP